MSLVDQLEKLPITLIEAQKKHTEEEILNLFPGKTVVVCDFYVEGMETSQEIVGGYQSGRIINIDHHAPTKRMQRQISATNLALEYVAEFGPVPADWAVVINHTDADSVMSSLIVRGILPPAKEYGNVAIAADHTGQECLLADLLNAVQKAKKVKLSLEVLDLFLKGHHAAHDYAIKQLKEQYDRRKKAQELAKNMEVDHGVAFAEIDEKIDISYFLPFLPTATVILIFSPLGETTETKIRLGNGAPDGLTLFDLHLENFDPAFGGRWNAGSNKRGGGTTMDPKTYVTKAKEALVRHFA